MPHPLLPKMNVRVVTKSSPALDVVDECAANLVHVFTHIEAVFDAAVSKVMGADADTPVGKGRGRATVIE